MKQMILSPGSESKQYNLKINKCIYNGIFMRTKPFGSK